MSFDSSNAEARLAATKEAGLVDVDDGTLLPVLLERLDDEAPRVRHAALEAIGMLAYRAVVTVPERAVDRIIAKATDDIIAVRAEAAVTLAIATDGPPKVVAALLELIDDDADAVRREAAAALGDVNAGAATKKLIVHLEDEDRDVRFEVAFALATLKEAAGLQQLVASLGDPRRRLDACEGLRRLDSAAAIEPLNVFVSRRLLPWPERLTALATLHSLGDPHAGAALVGRTRAWASGERAFALGLIGSHQIAAGKDALLAVATKASDKLRAIAIRALGELGDPSAAEVLSSIAAERRLPEAVRTEVDDALAKLQGTAR